MITEIWRGIVLEIPKELLGLYEVSSFGRIRRKEDGKTLALCKDKDGYYLCKMKRNGVSKSARVHRIVAASFCDNYSKDRVVNHINFDRADNRMENLEWVSIRENNTYSSSKNRKFSKDQVLEIYRLRKSGLMYKEIAVLFNSTADNIKNIVMGYIYADIKALAVI